MVYIIMLYIVRPVNDAHHLLSLPLVSLESVASLLSSTLYQGKYDRNHMLLNITSTDTLKNILLNKSVIYKHIQVQT
jgi:hypothetical protein